MEAKPLKVPQTETKTETKTPEEVPKETTMTTTETHKHQFVPLWMSVVVFVLIVLAYTYCAIMGIEVNAYREVVAIGISGFLAFVCGYLYFKSE